MLCLFMFLQEFSEALIPLLFDAFIELVPGEKNIMGNNNIGKLKAILLT